MAFNIWDWDNKPELTGKLVMKKSHVPPWNKKIYGIEQDNGEVVYTWGYWQLVSELATLPFLTKLKIRYLGKGADEGGAKNRQNVRCFQVDIISFPKKSKKADALEKKLSRLKENENQNIK